MGRWSVQKGVDLIADVFPAVLDKHPEVQLICIGPVIDLHGKFAALKLEAIMKKYPGRVYSKPEFTALPPYIFSGAEFALIPSRDEPFGLVAVEFGRKGALGVGARVGGLGQMPGWWFTVESTTTKHMIHQFKAAIEDALGSSTSVRAEMRARSAKQRFPVAKWVEDLEILQSAAIRIHDREQRPGRHLRRRSGQLRQSMDLSALGISTRAVSTDRLSHYEEAASEETADDSSRADGLGRTLSLGRRAGPGHRLSPNDAYRLPPLGESDHQAEEVEISREAAEAAAGGRDHNALARLEGRIPPVVRDRRISNARLVIPSGDGARGRSNERAPGISVLSPGGTEAQPMDFTMLSRDRSRSVSPIDAARLSLLPSDGSRGHRRLSSASSLSLVEVTHGRQDFNLQKVELNFTDSNGEYYQKFQQMLEQKLDAKSSESSLVIEDFLKASEKEWAANYRNAKLGRGRSPSPLPLSHRRVSSHGSGFHSPAGSIDNGRASSIDGDRGFVEYEQDEFLLGQDYVRPPPLQRWLQTRIYDWPIYSIFLALGQILAANSYQIVLLTGGSAKDEATKLYIIGGIYIVASCLWWVLYRTMKPRVVMALPFAFYGLAFVLVGVAPLVSAGGRDWIRNVATGLYAAASASGSLYFALNFGDEGKSDHYTIYRRC